MGGRGHADQYQSSALLFSFGRETISKVSEWASLFGFVDFKPRPNESEFRTLVAYWSLELKTVIFYVFGHKGVFASMDVLFNPFVMSLFLADHQISSLGWDNKGFAIS